MKGGIVVRWSEFEMFGGWEYMHEDMRYGYESDRKMWAWNGCGHGMGIMWPWMAMQMWEEMSTWCGVERGNVVMGMWKYRERNGFEDVVKWVYI